MSTIVNHNATMSSKVFKILKLSNVTKYIIDYILGPLFTTTQNYNN